LSDENIVLAKVWAGSSPTIPACQGCAASNGGFSFIDLLEINLVFMIKSREGSYVASNAKAIAGNTILANTNTTPREKLSLLGALLGTRVGCVVTVAVTVRAAEVVRNAPTEVVGDAPDEPAIGVRYTLNR
jgi:hypothetical protein